MFLIFLIFLVVVPAGATAASPDLEIQKPDTTGVLYTNQDKVDIEGRVSQLPDTLAADSVQIFVNSVQYQDYFKKSSDTSGTFALGANIENNNDTNEFEILVERIDSGDTDLGSVTVYHDNINPALVEIETDPETDPMRTTSETVWIRTVVEGGDTLSIHRLDKDQPLYPKDADTFTEYIHSDTREYIYEGDLRLGLNEFLLSARDRADNLQEEYVTFERDTGPPFLEIREPVSSVDLDDVYTNEGSMVVSGLIGTDAETLAVNGSFRKNPGGDQDTFSVDVALDTGVNDVVITASDDLGNDTSDTITIVRDPSPPEVQVDAPVEGNSYFGLDLYNGGVVSDSYGLKDFTVNGGQLIKDLPYEAVNLDTTYSDSITLTSGDKVDGSETEYYVRFVAEDLAGNVFRDTMTVYVIDEGPGITLKGVEPHSNGNVYQESEYSFRTNADSLDISGTVGAKVDLYLYGNDGDSQHKVEITSGDDYKFDLPAEVVDLNQVNSFVLDAHSKSGDTFSRLDLRVVSDLESPSYTRYNPDPAEDPHYVGIDEFEFRLATELGATLSFYEDREADGSWTKIEQKRLAAGWFEDKYELTEGENRFKFELEDRVGNTTVDTFRVYWNTTPPPLEIVEPDNDYYTYKDKIPLEGVTDSEAVVTVENFAENFKGGDEPLVDKQVGVDESGKFTTYVELEDELNEIFVTTSNKLGNERDKYRAVHKLAGEGAGIDIHPVEVDETDGRVTVGQKNVKISHQVENYGDASFMLEEDTTSLVFENSEVDTPSLYFNSEVDKSFSFLEAQKTREKIYSVDIDTETKIGEYVVDAQVFGKLSGTGDTIHATSSRDPLELRVDPKLNISLDTTALKFPKELPYEEEKEGLITLDLLNSGRAFSLDSYLDVVNPDSNAALIPDTDVKINLNAPEKYQGGKAEVDFTVTATRKLDLGTEVYPQLTLFMEDRNRGDLRYLFLFSPSDTEQVMSHVEKFSSKIDSGIQLKVITTNSSGIDQNASATLDSSFDSAIKKQKIRALLGAHTPDFSAVRGQIESDVQYISELRNYPNPFDPQDGSTKVAFRLGQYRSEPITVRIFTLAGELVLEKQLRYQEDFKWVHYNDPRVGWDERLYLEWKWDGRSGVGKEVSSGGYVLQMTATDSEGDEIQGYTKIAVSPTGGAQ